MSSHPLTVPETVSFEQAITLTQALLSQVEARELSQSDVAALVAELVQTEAGARGFFVTSLTSKRSIVDNPSTLVVEALRSRPEVVAELLVKNLAMSAVQAVVHRQNQKEEMAQGSERVHQRTAHLINLLALPAGYERLQKLSKTTATGKGDYKAFLERWGYNAEQRQVIHQAVEQVLSMHPKP